MEKIKDLLEKRKDYLLDLQNEKEKALEMAPEGSLRFCSYAGKVQYYHRKRPEDADGTYIRGKETDLISKLAQKDYDKKVISVIKKERKAIDKYLSNYPQTVAEKVYEKLHSVRQNLVKPIRDADETYVRKWEEIKYEGKGFSQDIPELYTSKGERVRSKSEVIIADLLSREGIPYRYEYPVFIKGWGNLYPDFTVLNVAERREFYWEHFGMMDDEEYVEKALQKIALYEMHGIFPGEQLILTFETRKNPVNHKLIMCMIDRYLKKKD